MRLVNTPSQSQIGVMCKARLLMEERKIDLVRYLNRDWNEISQVPDLVVDDVSLKQKLQNMQTGTRTRFTGIASGFNDVQQRPIRIRFESVCFIDAQTGWVAGGYDVPGVDRSRAVVMRTIDGGQSWEAIRSLVIPRINKIHFTDQLNGWAVGRIGNLFQTGVFHTSNGGQTWSSQSSSPMPGWVDAVQTKLGLLTLDYDGQPGLLNRGRFEASVIRAQNLTRINQVVMADAQQGWAVGEQGTLLNTTDGGRSFSPLTPTSFNAGQSSDRVASSIKNFDLRSVAVTPQQIWFAGDPGTMLFSVDRKTGTTIASRLPIQSRINKIHFADDQHGWAVGAMGCIVATSDGGKTWSLQRGKNRTVAMLVINSSPSSIGYELFSRYASQDNRSCASILFGADAKQYQTITQATDRLGGTTSVLFDPIDVEATDQRLVRLIRSLQPRLIVLNLQPSDEGHDNAQKMMRLVHRAVASAAQRNAYQQQITDVGLKPWQVNRLATTDPSGGITINATQLLPRTGMLIEDQIAISRAVTGQSILPQQTLRYRVTELTSNGPIKAADLLSGLTHLAARRVTGNEVHGNLTSIHQASAKQETFERFLKFESNTTQDFVVWRQQVESFALKMDSSVAGVWLMQLAQRYYAAGKVELAAASAELLVMRWSENAFAPAALSWLTHYYASDELGQIEFSKRVSSGSLGGSSTSGAQPTDQIAGQISREDLQTTTQMVQTGGVSQLIWKPIQKDASDGASDQASMIDASADVSISELKRQFFEARRRKAGSFLTRLGRSDPELIASPELRLLKAQLSRQAAGSVTNENLWKSLLEPKGTSYKYVSIAAQRELSIAGFTAVGDRDFDGASCIAAPQRPRLDGRLLDDCWNRVFQSSNEIQLNQNIETIAAHSLQAARKSDTVAMSYDEEFLYVAIVCQKAKDYRYEQKPHSARPRDPDLSGRDQVTLRIDTDRDYRSAFEFTIDHRGWVNESCAGSRPWDPDWYVAQSENDSSWTVEVAIPLNEIAAQMTKRKNNLGDRLGAERLWQSQCLGR